MPVPDCETHRNIVALSAEVVRKTKPGEGTRVVDYTPQSLCDSPPTLVGQFFFCVVSQVIRYGNKYSPWGRESTAEPGEGTKSCIEYYSRKLRYCVNKFVLL